APVRRGPPNALIRDATSVLGPEEIRSAVKRGFTVPTATLLLDSPHSPLRTLLTSPRLADRGLIDAGELARLLDAGSGVPNRELKLFTVASLELWLRANVDRVSEEPPESLEELLDPSERSSLATAV